MIICEFLHLNFNLKRVYCVCRGEGARGPGPREWGPRGSLTIHGGPAAPGLAPAGAVGPTRQPHPRAGAADGQAPRGGHSARPKAATRRGRREAAPAPLWSPAAAIGTAERRPREEKGRGKRGGGPRLTLGRRRRRKRRRGSGRRGRRCSGGRRTRRGGGRGRRRCGEAGGGDAGAGDGPGEQRRPAGGRRRRRRERATARARFRRGDGAARGGNGRERRGEGLNRVGRGRERPEGKETGAGGPAAINGAGVICEGQIRPFEREREREKWGERERGSRGVIPPTLLHAGTAGGGGIHGGGGARARGRRRERREEGDDGWAPPISEGGRRARLSAARAGRGRVGRGERRERGRGGEMGRAGPREGRGTFRVFLFIKSF
uniref:Splicing coactivator subunit-like protein n=1 Tax=Oryza sativa subsp. indica TaxID=39946 RepID=C8TFN7_ORYSI|nr:splicing coactivator subunit-like protein [Oryza sativa Indica Group]